MTPENDGLRADASLDLAKQIRLAARNKRLARRMGDARILRESRMGWWMVALGLSFILSGLAAAMSVARYFHGP